MFWSNTFWFILLGISTLIQLVLILIKTKDKKHAIALYIVISGQVFTIEAIIYCFLRVYDYYPMIFPVSPINDGLAGNLFSQFSLSASALCIAVFRLKNYWILIFAGIYFAIEKLFLWLDIFSHNFYSTWVTFSGLLLLFFVTQQLYKHKAIFTTNRIFKYYFMFLGLYTLHMPTALWIQIVTGIMTPNLIILSNEMRSYALICLINLFLLSSVCLFVYYSKIYRSWKLLITLSLYGFLYLAYLFKIIYVRDGWFLIFATINIFSMYFYISILSKLLNPKGIHFTSP